MKKKENSKPSTNDSLPQYWELLSEEDQANYIKLKRELSVESIKKSRNSKLESFEGILEMTKAFVVKNNEDDWKRCLVCGICWMDDSIAINTRQLRILLTKCKSSINGSLQKMGYSTNMSHAESWKILFPYIPLLKDHFNELRQWTIRQKGVVSSQRTPKAKLEKIQLAPKPQKVAPAQPPVNVNTKVNTEIKKPSVPLKFRNKMNRIHETVQTPPSIQTPVNPA